MTRYAALVRGVNVGGRNRLPMALLREIATGLGHGEPATLLQSGNLVLGSDADEATVAAGLRAALADRAGLDVAVLVRDHAQLAAVLAANPLRDPPDESRFFVAFAADPLGDALAGVEVVAPEELAVVGREVYSWLPDGMGRGLLTTAVLERAGVTLTARNWRTVRALVGLTAQ